MGGRRFATNHRLARSTSVRISSRIRVWTAASSLLSQALSSCRSGRDPKTSRATKLAPTSSGALAPVSPPSRARNVMPAPLTRSLTTWVTMISRRSGWSPIWAWNRSRIAEGK